MAIASCTQSDSLLKTGNPKRAGELGYKAYLLSVSVMGLVVLLISMAFLPLQEWQGILLFALLCGVAQIMPIPLFRSSSVSVSAAVTFASILLYGPIAAIWVNMGSSLVSAFRPRPKPLHKTIFNISNHALAAGVAGAAYWAVGGTIRPDDPIRPVFPILLAAISYFVVQTVLIAGVIALKERVPFRETWDTNFRWSALNFVALGVISLGMANAELSMGILGIFIFSIPLVMSWYSLRLYVANTRAVRMQNEALRMANEKLEAAYLSTVQALAAAIDAKDHNTHGHSELTMRYATAIATELGLAEDEVAGVQIAALLHDVGKIGIPDGILNKPSKLTDEEWVVIREHPVVGARVIEKVDLLSFAVDAIQHHHERYAGQGYPSGLRGEQIPLPAQIIAVADTFQAMTSSRPYRKAHNSEEALNELSRCAGTHFSPRVVDAMVTVIRTGKWTREVATPRLPRLFRLEEEDVRANAN